MQGGGAEISRSHGLPSASWASTESMSVDGQASYEKAVMKLMHVLSTVNIIWGIGQLESQRTISLPQMVIDDELAGVVYRVQSGIEVTDETLAYDVIAELGSTADYMGHDHTLDHFKTEVHYGDLTWTDRRERWEQAGHPDLTERAKQKVAEILEGPAPCYLDDDVRRELGAVEEKWMGKVRA
jgi:trimethylamine--corrinoid protein Co-methyltransferase